MYKKESKKVIMGNLPLFLDNTLNPNNRWVKLSSIVPWDIVEEIYSDKFVSKRGPKALSSRIAFGSLIIQVKLNLTDAETVNQIRENPYLQYFIGLEKYEDEAPFDSSMMTHFRKRLNMSDIKEIDSFLHDLKKSKEEKSKNEKSDDDESGNKGKLIIDATCAPADIHYPTDLGLLNKAREKTEKMIDILWQTRSNKKNKIKPRAYRKKGRSSFTAIIKQKRTSKAKLRGALRIQLSCIKRNLQSIYNLSQYSDLTELGVQLYKDLFVIQTLYLQQQEMFDKKIRSVDNRIVSINQPHVRPIIRGKAAAKTEFGAKVSISLVDDWSFVDTISFDAYNEGSELQEQIEKYKERFGCYPESVHVDKIYRNRNNRLFCKENEIRISGPKLGRPVKNENKLKEQRLQEYEDEGVRNSVEGRFGVGKRKYSLDKIMTKLKETSETVIALIFMIMNLDVILQVVCLRFSMITIAYNQIWGVIRKAFDGYIVKNEGPFYLKIKKTI